LGEKLDFFNGLLEGSLVYGGVRTDARAIASGPGCPGGILVPLFCVIDMPFSLVGDTLALPYTLTIQVKQWLRTDERLYGTWIWDPQKTMEYYEHSNWPKSFWQDLPEVCGKNRITFSKRAVLMEIVGRKDSRTYSVLRKDARSVELLLPPSITFDETGPEFMDLHYEQNGFWFEFHGRTEYYKKVDRTCRPAASGGGS
jgi:uncharacterized protein YceK